MNTHGQNIKIGLVLLLVGVLVAVWFVLRGRSVPDNGVTASSVGNQIQQITTNQHGIVEGLSATERGLEEIQRRNNSMEDKIRESGVIIGECQQILRNVREAGKGTNP